MRFTKLLALWTVATLCPAALADDVYNIHENLHVGQKVTYLIAQDNSIKSTSTTKGVATVTNTQDGQHWKLTLTILAEQDGSATRSQADIDPSSYDTSGPQKQKQPCPAAGVHILLHLHPDGTQTSDFQGNLSDDDTNLLNGAIAPDEAIYPDKPVAVGDVWDASEKVAKYAGLGPNDQLSCRCKLDWVKTVDGKQIAQISYSEALIQHEDGNVQQDFEWTVTCLVDIAAGMITRCDETGTSKFITPASEPTQVTGGSQLTFHCEVLPPNSTTQP